nr:MAG TPA: hypothetical protein [Caudoviricetes sp.]
MTYLRRFQALSCVIELITYGFNRERTAWFSI